MDNSQNNIFRVRVISTLFTVVAIAVFKPFGLDAWQWQVYVHLLAIMVLGLGVCLLSDAVMKYIMRMPCNMDDIRKIPSLAEMDDKRISNSGHSYGEEINYFIRHNLYFQLINTILVALMLCLYRHFLLSDGIPSNRLSWSNFFETLIIIAFCSFAIGLYWRFKFRSKYLAVELEETRLLNEQLKIMQAKETQQSQKPLQLQKPQESNQPQESQPVPNATLTLTGTTSETVSLQAADLLYIETVGNYVKVYHLRDGQVRNDMLRATSKQMEDELRPYPMIVRCHRAFIVNLGQVEQIVTKTGSMQLVIRYSHDSVPVSRSNIAQIKEAIKKA